VASGQQLAEQNIAAFRAWASSKSDDDFREYVHRGRLKRAEIATECGFGKSALLQNPVIREALEELESALRHRKILPPVSDSEDSEKASIERMNRPQYSRHSPGSGSDAFRTRPVTGHHSFRVDALGYKTSQCN